VISFWTERIATNPSAYLDLTYLGEAYARKARETGDVGSYERAETALRKALDVNESHVPASALLSSVLFSAHDFRGALRIAEPIADHPEALQALATVGDARLALGDYERAATAYETLRARAPVPAALTRLAALGEVRGDREQALALAYQALDLARESGDSGESLAWLELQAGELEFRSGRLEQAEGAFRASLAAFPGYYAALGGLAKVRAAEGDYPGAAGLYERAVAVVPQPELLAALGDVYSVLGRDAEAQDQYETVELIGKLAEINEQVYNRQLALFFADHDRRLDEALLLSMAELKVRKDVFGYDAAAWAAYKNGLLDRADELAAKALALGTQDARLYYHAGMIAKAQGRVDEARGLLERALAINPHFDLLQARVAQAALNTLRDSAID
jgi:tetratricopeptide (TPR) repeat protein